MWFLWCNSFMFCSLDQSNLGFLLKNTIHYDQFCQFKHAWVYVWRMSPFFICTMHAHLKKNMFNVYAHMLLTRLSMHMPVFMTNGHHPFPYLLCMHVQKKTCPMLCLAGLVCHKYSYARAHWASTMIFLLIPYPLGRIESKYPPNINWNPIQCEHGFGFSMFWVLCSWHCSRISFMMFWYSNPQRRNKWLFRAFWIKILMISHWVFLKHKKSYGLMVL
jgi:hypothetical protein